MERGGSVALPFVVCIGGNRKLLHLVESPRWLHVQPMDWLVTIGTSENDPQSSMPMTESHLVKLFMVGWISTHKAELAMGTAVELVLQLLEIKTSQLSFQGQCQWLISITKFPF